MILMTSNSEPILTILSGIHYYGFSLNYSYSFLLYIFFRVFISFYVIIFIFSIFFSVFTSIIVNVLILEYLYYVTVIF
jgi:hypothetical protein